MNVVLWLAAFVGALLAFGAAQVVVHRYRRAMVEWMAAEVPGSADATPAAQAGPAPPVDGLATQPPARVTLADNRAAAWRVTVLLIVLALLIAVSDAAVTLALPGNEQVFNASRLATLAAVQSWPVLPALALLWHWPRRRVVWAMLAWLLTAAAFVMWRSTDQATWSGVFAWLLFAEAGPALALVALLTAGRATRAVAPWLWLPLALAVAAVLAPLAWLLGAAAPPPAFVALAGWLGLWGALAALMLAALALAVWPLRRLGLLLAAAYRRKWLTELMVLFIAVVGVVQGLHAVVGLGANGALALAYLLPLAWVPAALSLGRGLGRPAGRPPNLLVLRVFQRDEAVGRLFDEVIERWRLTGNTLLIAGTDLAERTIDAEDIFLFLGGRLRERFVLAPGELAPRLAAFDLARDVDGRHRINEVYCHDRTWELALDELVARADVVLMDLRGFQRRHRGCRHELGVLACAPRLARAVVLVDRDTDRVAAQAAAAGAPLGRFEWVDSSTLERGAAGRVLARLCVAG